MIDFELIIIYHFSNFLNKLYAVFSLLIRYCIRAAILAASSSCSSGISSLFHCRTGHLISFSTMELLEARARCAFQHLILSCSIDSKSSLFSLLNFCILSSFTFCSLSPSFLLLFLFYIIKNFCLFCFNLFT